MSKFKRGVIIGNCQTSVLARMLNVMCPGVRMSAFQVHLETTDSARRLRHHLSDFDVVVSMPLSDVFREISASELKRASPEKTEFITNVYFTGLHPDFTFLGSLGERCVGPLGNYHSKLVFGSFLSGLSESECESLFCEEVYRSLGYYLEFATSEAKLRELDNNASIPFADAFFNLTRHTQTLLTFNHPATAAFVTQALQIAVPYGIQPIEGVPNDTLFYGNELSDGPALPIYPEIAAQSGIEYSGNYLFKTAASELDNSRFVSLQEYVRLEYEFLLLQDREALQRFPQWLMFEPRFIKLMRGKQLAFSGHDAGRLGAN